MRTFAYPRYVLSIGAAAALLTACGGFQPQAGAALDAYSAGNARQHRDHGKSWMLPAAKTIKELLYVSDWATDDVFVYDYAKGTLVGKLTGLNSPDGQCVDAKGDVWITDLGNNEVIEYAHGGSQPLQTLATDGEPVGCSVDPTTGNLAVAGEMIDVFAHARGQKHTYQNAVCFPFWAPGYDNKGNLYALGLLYGSARQPLTGFTDPVPCELPHGRDKLRPVHMSGLYIVYAGSIMWDGKHLTVTDQNYEGKAETGIYRVKEGASGNLTAIGETVLNDDCGGTGAKVAQPFIVGEKNTPINSQEGHTVVGSDQQCTSNGSSGTVDYWAYPGGGMPTSSLASPPAQPRGEAVSIL